jgi:hypothetical protein
MTLRATLEIVPFGNEDAKRTISTINMHNSAETDSSGRYRYYGDIDGKKYDNIWHHRKHGAHTLLLLFLEAQSLDYR